MPHPSVTPFATRFANTLRNPPASLLVTPFAIAFPTFLAVTLMAAPAQVQAADPRYPVMDAGALMRQAEQSRTANQTQRALGQLPLLAPPLVLGEAASVQVSGFAFAGVHLIAPETLQAAVAPFANRPLGQAELEHIAVAVAQAYRQAGWVVRVYVPKQPLPTDTLTVQVLETIPPPSPK